MKLALAFAVLLVGGASVSGQQSQLGMGAKILSDTQGVDFNPYMTKLLATLKRNWLYSTPESARKHNGVVYATFQINPDGSIPAPDPILERTSGEKDLDDAAMAAIHASNPFEPLPSKFHGPYLRLRIEFIYKRKQNGKVVPILRSADDLEHVSFRCRNTRQNPPPDSA